MKTFAAACVAGGVLLTGCVPPPPRPSLANFAHTTVTNGGSRITMTDTRIVLANTPLKINFIAAKLNPDCTASSDGQAIISVVTLPQHGTVNLNADNEYLVFPATSPLAHCNTVKVPGTEIMYTPATGYVGPDYTSIKIYVPSGREFISDVTLNVGG